MHKYTGTQVHLYSSTSGHRYTVIRVYEYIGITLHLVTDACTGAPVHRYDNTRCTRRPTLDLPSTSSANWKKPNWHDCVDDSLPRSDFQPRQRGLLNPSCSALLLGWSHACVARGNSIKDRGFNNACAGHHSKKRVYQYNDHTRPANYFALRSPS